MESDRAMIDSGHQLGDACVWTQRELDKRECGAGKAQP